MFSFHCHPVMKKMAWKVKMYWKPPSDWSFDRIITMRLRCVMQNVYKRSFPGLCWLMILVEARTLVLIELSCRRSSETGGNTHDLLNVDKKRILCLVHVHRVMPSERRWREEKNREAGKCHTKEQRETRGRENESMRWLLRAMQVSWCVSQTFSMLPLSFSWQLYSSILLQNKNSLV